MSKRKIDFDAIVVNFDNDAARQRVLSRIAQLRGQREISVRLWSGSKSNQQMRYYRGFIVRPLWKMMREQGDMRTAEEWHKFLAAMFLTESVYHPKTGDFLGNTVRSTSDLVKPEFSEYIDLCIAWIADTTGYPVEPPLKFLTPETYQPQARGHLACHAENQRQQSIETHRQRALQADATAEQETSSPPPSALRASRHPRRKHKRQS
jgi:hypothetical protein